MTEMNSCPQPAQEAAFRELADGGVVLHLGSGQYHGVNTVGALIWGLMDGSRTVPQIASALAELVEQPPAELEYDVAAFVSDLRERGLVAA
jgi:hypothetical protein